MMDPNNPKQLRSSLTLHFAIIAVLTAMLVSYGSDSIFLPTFILIVCIVGFIVVDSLEVFALNRVGVFIGMTLGTTIAIGYYIYSAIYLQSESGQLHSVASLLVFPEAVLFWQRKNLRVFEQLAIFLLLEMMVAALVNDNIMFGILLIPIVLIWVSSLFLFSRYATLVQIAPDIEVPMPKLAELLYARFKKRLMGDEKKHSVVEPKLVAKDAVAAPEKSRWMQSVPLGVSAIVFSMLFFYLLPRATTGGYRPRLGSQARVGLPSDLKLGQLGKALSDPTPVMRLTLKHDGSRRNYDVQDGPYIRARVYDRFRRDGANSQWHLFRAYRAQVELDRYKELGAVATANRDRVQVEFDLLPRTNVSTFTIPPIYLANSGKAPTSMVDTYTQLMDTERTQDVERHNQPYTLGSTGFWNGQDLPITPMLNSGGISENSSMYLKHVQSLVQFNFDDFPGVEALRQRIIQEAGVPESSPLKVAEAFEDFLKSGREYKYTLDLSGEPNPQLDPIEDFVVNQRKGHCQFFAATMLIMLRQSDIKSRLVVGYKPREFNKHGRYFFVKQNDAHAWVEALFHYRQLRGTEYEKWIQPDSYYWVRFDPTPPSDEGEESIIDQPNGLSDYAEKLWKGYVLEGRELTGENSIYAPVARVDKDTYAQIAREWSLLIENLKSGNFGAAASSIRFSWPLAALIIVIGFLCVFFWQLALMSSSFLPVVAERLGLRSRDSAFKQEFFARCVRTLRKLGFERESSQTPAEITQLAANYLHSERGLPDSNEWLRLLTKNYYLLRFGDSSGLSEEEQAEVQQALKNLEKSVAQIEKQSPHLWK